MNIRTFWRIFGAQKKIGGEFGYPNNRYGLHGALTTVAYTRSLSHRPIVRFEDRSTESTENCCLRLPTPQNNCTCKNSVSPGKPHKYRRNLMLLKTIESP